MLHRPKSHHATLASDLMEEWRAIIVDDTVLSLIRSFKLTREHFEDEEQWGYALTREGREIFLRALGERMLEIHPYAAEDPKRYPFYYMVEKQLSSLHQVFVERDAHHYLSNHTEG